jgi:hypothetical protein
MDAARPNHFEIWKTQNSIVAPNGQNAFRFAWYWSVSNPARYFDPRQPGGLARTLDNCWASAKGGFLVISNPCVNIRKSFGAGNLTWDDPRSPFTGAQRGIRLDSFTLKYPVGPTVWYTDALGMNPSLTPFPGSVQQEVSNINHTPNQYVGGSVGRDFGVPGVHAPN